MPRSAWSVAGEVLITVLLLVGPPWLATRLEWPLGQDTTWVWFLQYLRGGSIPDEVVLAFFVVFLWAVWAVHLVIVALDIIAVARGLVPRVGLVRLVWVLVAGGATATSTQTTALAAHTTGAVAEAPVVAVTPPAQETPVAEEERAKPQDVFERTSILAGFGFDSADLTPEMAEALEPTIGLIADFGHSEEPVVVTGHTDPVGDPFYNRGLSERRAQAVADHLGDQLDADVEIQVIGKGAAQPPSNPHASYGQYRRVEISYTVQRPTPAPEPSAVSEAEAPSETSSDAGSAPDRVGTRAATAAEENTVLDLAGVGVVSGAVGAVGAVGAGVGYAAGRRRASATVRKPGAGVGSTTGSDDPSGESSTDDPTPSQDGLVRQDAEGLARGVLDEDGYLLVADTVRVNSAGGVAFVGTHAARVLAAVATSHTPEPIIATRAVATALVAVGTPLGDVQVASNLAQVRVAAEAELLARARHQDEHGDEGGEPVTSAPRVLVMVEASDLDQGQGVPAVPATMPGAVVCVLGEADDVGATVNCANTHRVRVRTRDGEVTREGRLGLWSPHPSWEEPVGTTVDKEPSPVVDRTGGTEAGGPDEVEEDRPEPLPEDGPHTKARVRLFAPEVVCEVDGRDVLQGTRTSTYTLLAVLALGPREGVCHQDLTQVLAPEMSEAQARRFRSNAVTTLRKAVRDALELGPEVPIVENDKGRYQLQWEYFDIDVRQFCGLYDQVRKSEGAKVESQLREMVGLYRADLLADIQDEWFVERREELQEIVADVYGRLLDYVDDGEERLGLIDAALRVDSLNEVLHQEKMKYYASLGRKDAVHRCFKVLKDELHRCGDKPGAESQALFESLVR